MTYPPSGSGYGQGDAGAQSAYGQQSGYGQQQYGQQQAGYGQEYGAQQQYNPQQYGQQQYGQQQYGQQEYGQQQYGQQGHGYQAPKPAGQGLPANTPTILAGVIAGLGVITLFCGFLAGFKETSPMGGDFTAKLFETPFVAAYALLAVAGFVAGASFLLGVEKWVVGTIFALTGVSAVVSIFQFAGLDASKGIGAVLLLVFSILAFIAAILWLLIEAGQVKTAPATDGAAASAPAPASTATPAQAAPAAEAASYGYGTYGQQTQQPAAGYGQQAQASYSAGSAYGQPAAGASYGQQSDPAPSNPLPAADSDAGATTAFVKPEVKPESGQH